MWLKAISHRPHKFSRLNLLPGRVGALLVVGCGIRVLQQHSEYRTLALGSGCFLGSGESDEAGVTKY